MEKYAIVTGASDGIGRAICEALCREGVKVFGIGRKMPQPEIPGLTMHLLDMVEDPSAACDLVARLAKEYPIDLLVNNAGCAFYGLHENLNLNDIHSMVTLNMELPMLFTRILLPKLRSRKGTVVMISSVTAQHASPHAAAYGATKAGLAAFSESIFEEVRKHGVKVVTIAPDLTRTHLYRNADFTTSDAADECLYPSDVADAVLFALQARPGSVIREITLRPQKNRIVKK